MYYVIAKPNENVRVKTLNNGEDVVIKTQTYSEALLKQICLHDTGVSDVENSYIVHERIYNKTEH
jgi:hypothetical protein